MICHVFSFQHRTDEPFSTEPIKNSAQPLSFQHVQQVCQHRLDYISGVCVNVT